MHTWTVGRLVTVMMKTTKRISALLFAVVLMLCTSISVFAVNEYTLIDDANLFTYDETVQIEEAMSELSEKTGWEIVVYTNENYVNADDMTAYYNDFYDSNDFKDDGIIFVIDMGYGNRVINTEGEAEKYFPVAEMDELKYSLLPYLNDNDFYSATMEFIKVTGEIYDRGVPIDGDYSNIYEPATNDYAYYDDYEYEKEPFTNIIAACGWGILLIALVVATACLLIVVVRYKNHGKYGTYDLNANSNVRLKHKEDIFLYKTVTVTEERDDDDDHDFGSSSSDSDSCGSSGSF